MTLPKLLRPAVLTLLLAAAWSSPQAKADSLYFDPTPQTVLVGQTFSLTVFIGSIADLAGFNFDLTYTNPALASYQSTSQGTFFTDGVFIPGFDLGNGTIEYVAHAGAGAVSPIDLKSGSLAVFQFEALAAGVMDFDLANILLVNGTSGLSMIPSSVGSASVTINSVPTVPEPSVAFLFVAALSAPVAVRIHRGRRSA